MNSEGQNVNVKSVYVGDFYDNKRHGKGKWIKDKNSDSNEYQGEYLNDRKHGYGEFKWKRYV